LYIRKLPFLFLTVLGLVSMVAAQTECTAIVEQAVEVMDMQCRLTERNQACYGNSSIMVQAQPNASIQDFDSPGDITAVENIQSLILSPLDEITGQWGVALMQIQANLPQTLPGQNVTILLFGDVELTNAGEAMEAFFFRSGVGAADCSQAPDGMLIQTPAGQGTINLTVNNAQISLGSTAYLTAETKEEMTVALLDGDATVGVAGDAVSFASGEFTTVPLDAKLMAIGPPSEPKTIEDNLELPDLPFDFLSDDSSGDSDEDDDSSSATSSGDIIPVSGSWVFTRGEIASTGGCPVAMTENLTQNMPVTSTSFVDIGGKPFDLEELFLQSNGGEPVVGEFLRPEPNVFQYRFDEAGSFFLYQLTFLSNRSIDGLINFVVNIGDFRCEVTIPFEVELAQ